MISPFANRNGEELINIAIGQIASSTDLVTAKEKDLEALMNAEGNNSDNVLPVKLRMFTADKKR